MRVILRVRNLTVHFRTPQGIVRALENVSLDVIEGEILGILGESGSGKSVLGQAILRLLPSNAVVQGSILYEGKDVLRMSREEIRRIRGAILAWVPQNTGSSLNPVLRVGFQVMETPLEHGVGEQEATGIMTSLFNTLGLKPPLQMSRRYPHELSGGQRQRVLVAIGASGSPRLMVMDEPTKGLDPLRKRALEKVIRRIREENVSLTIILVTHDLEFLEGLANRIAVMYCGWVVEVADAKRFFREPLHPYSRMLLETLPSRSFKPIPGDPPSMINPPRGCRFHPRCPYATEKCKREEPPTIVMGRETVRCWLYAHD